MFNIYYKDNTYTQLLADDAKVEYNFIPNNTSVVIENGTIVKMNKVYMP